ncbi:hypothetical protein BDN72DRAFT_770620, partial [Pluteus cervinus]
MSLVTSIHTAATARQKIDEEILRLESRIFILKCSRNDLSPIVRLHSEILQEIFVLASQSSKSGRIGKTALFISWICHSWRELALQTTELWSHIDFYHPAWIETALARTR